MTDERTADSCRPLWGLGTGTWFDVCLRQDEGALPWRMYVSRREERTVMLARSADGLHFGDAARILAPPADPLFHFNRACVLRGGERYLLYVTRQYVPKDLIGAWAEIACSESADGLFFPPPVTVLRAELPWEKQAVMCPHVIRDERSGRYRMWYSGGDVYEPDAIGYAESDDGLHWQRCGDGPVFGPADAGAWDGCKVTACQVVPERNGFRMFYTGFRDVDTAAIGTATSPDGIRGWRRSPAPLISPADTVWDRSACYKPFAVADRGRWRIYYNGRRDAQECICLVSVPIQDHT